MTVEAPTAPEAGSRSESNAPTEPEPNAEEEAKGGLERDEEAEKPSRTQPPSETGKALSVSIKDAGDGNDQTLPRPAQNAVMGIASLLAVVSVILILFYEPVSDLFFRYFSGPVIADAREQEVDRVDKGYNVYNTVAYGALFLAGGLAIYRLLVRLKIDIDEKLILASLPLIVLGGLARTLEDTRLFGEPLAYLFIAPVIYITLAVGAVGVLLWGALLRSFYHRVRPKVAGDLAAYGCFLFILAYFLMYHFGTDQLEHIVHPFLVLGLLGLIVLGAYGTLRLKPLSDPVTLLGLAGIFAVGLTLLWAGSFMTDPWREGVETQPDIAWEVALVWGGAMAVTIGGMLALKRLAPTTRDGLTPYLTPLSIALFAAHFLDGAATYLGIERYGYTEKHVLPEFLIDLFGTAAVMLPLKAGVVFLVVYMLDVVYKDDLADNRSMLMLVKLLILTLGLAPGTRDVARIFLGV